jgi:hypothetical protein
MANENQNIIGAQTGYECLNPNDAVFTPAPLAKAIIAHYKPTGVCLDPCRGRGAFYDYMPPNSDWCEIVDGRNFYDYMRKVDWIISNPPYSDYDKWLAHSFEVADNIVYLTPFSKVFKSCGTINSVLRFGGFKEILYIGGGHKCGFPFGFPCAAIHMVRGYSGETKICALDTVEICHTAPNSASPKAAQEVLELGL